jgi:hypothetical protein
MSLAGTARLTPHGKSLVASSMFRKGCSFIASYFLLLERDKSEPTEYVALHNLCQGVELILKSTLLLKDHDKFQPQLRGKFGHDLMKRVIELILKQKVTA